MCKRLLEKYRYLTIISAWLPRIRTRQTRSLVKARAEAPETVMASFVREVQGGKATDGVADMRFVEQDQGNETMYLRFASKVGRASLARPFSYYRPLDGTVVRRHILIDDGVDPLEVIGAVSIKVQDYVLAGKGVRVAVATYPIALGIAEPRYSMAGILIFRKLLESYPLNILGTGPPETNTVGKLCLMLGWRLSPVPYLFMPRRSSARG